MGGSSGGGEAPAPARGGSSNAISSLIAQFVSSGKSAPKPGEAINRIEKAIGAQLGAILQHPEVRRLEEAWRSLWFLVERTKKHSGIKIDVVCARPDEAAVALEKAIRGGSGTEPPASCAIADVVIDGSATGWARLEALAKVAEDYTCPVVVNGSPKLLGVDDLGSVERLDNKGGLFSAPAAVTWRSAAYKPVHRWITVAMNRVLARQAYDKKTSRLREGTIAEMPNDAGSVVWLSPAHLVGTLVMGSFRDTGWPCRIVGAKSGGFIENLPVREVQGAYEGEEGIAIPTEAFISTDTQRELGKCGVLMLASAPNSDAVYVLHAPTAYVTPPKKTYDSASTEPEVRLDRVSLVDQLFVGRLVQFLRALCSKIPPNSDPAEVQPVVQAAMWALFEDAKPGSIELSVKASKSADGGTVALSVTPRHFLGVGLDEISLEMPLG
jgi:type VI secretion system ImpC/EvpB family protein